MSQRVFCFVVVLIFFFNGEIFSQEKPLCVKLPINYNVSLSIDSGKSLHLNYVPKSSAHIFTGIKSDSINTNKAAALFVLPGPVLCPSFYSDHLGFFCKKELLLEKAVSVPIRFRLGSLAYVNYLEQKPGASKLSP